MSLVVYFFTSRSILTTCAGAFTKRHDYFKNFFARKTMELEVIILSPEMRQNAPRPYSNLTFQNFPGEEISEPR